MKRFFLVALSLCPVLALGEGFLPPKPQDTTHSHEVIENRLDRDESRLTQLEKFSFHNNAPTAQPPKVQDKARGASEVVVQVMDLENLYRDLNGKVETLLHRVENLEKNLETLSTDVDARMKFLESPKAHGVTDRPQSTLPAAPCATEKPHTLPCSPKPGDMHPENQADPGKAEKLSYDKAYAHLSQGDYAQAAEAFTVFLQEYHQSKYAPNAHYWMGESHFARKDFKKAAVVFGEGYKKYATSAKAPDFLLKLAKSLSTLGATGDACKALKKLKKDHPKAPGNVLSIAQKELDRLQCR